MKTFPILVLAVSACSDGSDRGSDAKPAQNIAATSQASVHTGVLATGFHGPVFVSDEEISAEKAKAKGGFWEVAGMPIKAEDAVRLEFRGLLDRAISTSPEAGLPRNHMQWRVTLEGASEAVPTDGYTHQFRVRRIISVEPCPKEPVGEQGCLPF